MREGEIRYVNDELHSRTLKRKQRKIYLLDHYFEIKMKKKIIFFPCSFLFVIIISIAFCMSFIGVVFEIPIDGISICIHFEQNESNFHVLSMNSV